MFPIFDVALLRVLAFSCLVIFCFICGCNSQQAQWEKYNQEMKNEDFQGALDVLKEIRENNPNATSEDGTSVDEMIKGTVDLMEMKFNYEQLKKRNDDFQNEMRRY